MAKKKAAAKTVKLVTRSELAELLVKKHEMSRRRADEQIKDMVDLIGATLGKGGVVQIHGIGKFYIARRGARPGRNPQTGATIKLPARKVVRFKPSTTLARAVRG